ncbi:unnamed protein product, partial [Polarella glacialis]
FACEPAESSEPLAQLVRRLQSRARGPCALEDCRRMRALLDSGDELMALGVDSPPEAIDSAAERRAHLSGLVLAASDLAFLALPRAMHLRWAELCTDLEAPDAAGWLRGEVELLAVPIYETLRAVGAAARQVPTSNSNSARPNVLSTPLRHLRDNARHWKETPLAPSSAAFQKKSQACREGVFTGPSRTVTHVSTMPPRLDAAQVTMIPDKFRGAHTKMDPAHVSPSRLREAACDPIVLPAALPVCGRSLPCSFRFKASPTNTRIPQNEHSEADDEAEAEVEAPAKLTLGSQTPAHVQVTEDLESYSCTDQVLAQALAQCFKFPVLPLGSLVGGHKQEQEHVSHVFLAALGFTVDAAWTNATRKAAPVRRFDRKFSLAQAQGASSQLHIQLALAQSALSLWGQDSVQDLKKAISHNGRACAPLRFWHSQVSRSRILCEQFWLCDVLLFSSDLPVTWFLSRLFFCRGPVSDLLGICPSTSGRHTCFVYRLWLGFPSCRSNGALQEEEAACQLLFRAKSRGWLELDVLMGTFAEKVVWDYDHANLDLLDEVLELENPDLFKWFTGQAAVPEEIKQNEVMVKMLEYVKTDQTGGFGPAARSM